MPPSSRRSVPVSNNVQSPPARNWSEVPADPDSPVELPRLLAEGLLYAPGFTPRGGTPEILRGVIARGDSGIALTATATELAGLRELADDLFGSITNRTCTVSRPRCRTAPSRGDCWVNGVVAANTRRHPAVAAPESPEAAIVLDRSGITLPAPLAGQTCWRRGYRRRGADVPDGPLTAASTMLSADADLVVLEHVPWAQVASAVVVTGPGFVSRRPGWSAWSCRSATWPASSGHRHGSGLGATTAHRRPAA